MQRLARNSILCEWFGKKNWQFIWVRNELTFKRKTKIKEQNKIPAHLNTV